MEPYVSFHRLDRSFEDGEKGRILPSSGGDAIMPFHCWGRVLDKFDRLEALTAPRSLFDRATFAFDAESASKFV